MPLIQIVSSKCAIIKVMCDVIAFGAIRPAVLCVLINKYKIFSIITMMMMVIVIIGITGCITASRSMVAITNAISYAISVNAVISGVVKTVSSISR